MPDPFIKVKEDVEQMLEDACAFHDVLVTNFEESGKVDSRDQQVLLHDLDTIDGDLDNLESSVSIVKDNRDKFSFDDKEVEAREAFVATCRAEVRELREDLLDAQPKRGRRKKRDSHSQRYGTVGDGDDEDTPSHPPDDAPGTRLIAGGWAPMLWVGFSTQLATGLTLSAARAIFEEQVADMAFRHEEAGIGFLRGFSAVVAQVLVGLRGQDRKRLLVRCSFALALAALALRFAPLSPTAIMLVCNILSGCGAPALAVATTYVADLIPQSRRLGAFALLYGLAFTFGRGPAVTLAAQIGVQASILVAAAISMFTAVFCKRRLPESLPARNRKKIVVPIKSELHRLFFGEGDWLMRPLVIALMLSMVQFGILRQIRLVAEHHLREGGSWLPAERLNGEQRLHFDSKSLIYAFTGGGAQLLVVRCAKRGAHPKRLLALSSVLSVTAHGLVLWGPNFVTFDVALVLGALSMLSVPCFFALTIEKARPDDYCAAMCFIGAARSIAEGAGPLLFRVLMDMTSIGGLTAGVMMSFMSLIVNKRGAPCTRLYHRISTVQAKRQKAREARARGKAPNGGAAIEMEETALSCRPSESV